MKNTVMKYGLISGLIISIFLGINIIVMKNPTNLGIAEVIGYISMLIALSAIFVGIKNYRDDFQGGTITFMTAFKVGLLITIIASLIYTISWAILSSIFLPDFHQQYSAFYIENLKENGASDIELLEAKNQVQYYQEKFKNPIFRWMMSFMEIFPVGLVMTLVASLLHKRK